MSNASERKHDKALEDTFPASDPPANSGITGAEQPDGPDADKPDKPSPKEPSHKRTLDERPTGTPTSDRHATETAHHSEHDTQDGEPAA